MSTKLRISKEEPKDFKLDLSRDLLDIPPGRTGEGKEGVSHETDKEKTGNLQD